VIKEREPLLQKGIEALFDHHISCCAKVGFLGLTDFMPMKI